LDFIKGVLEGKIEMEQGEVSAFSFLPAQKSGVLRPKPAKTRKRS